VETKVVGNSLRKRFARRGSREMQQKLEREVTLHTIAKIWK